MTDDSAGLNDSADFNDSAGLNDSADLNDTAGLDDSADPYVGADDDGAGFDEAFFSSLEAGPDEDPAEAIEEDLVPDEALDLDGGDGVDEIFYEAEGDGSFETEAADQDADDFPFDLGGEG